MRGIRKRGIGSVDDHKPLSASETGPIVQLLRREGFEVWPGARDIIARLHGRRFPLRRRDYLVIDFVEVLDILPGDVPDSADDLLAGRFIPLGYSGGHSVFFLAESGNVVEFPSTDDDPALAWFSIEDLR